jgi:DUF1680 family protein
MLDKMLAFGEHQIDIDIVHFTHKPFRLGGAIEHSKEHAMGNVSICHQWTEGMLDYYHYTGDERVLETVQNLIKNLVDILENHVLPNCRYGAPRQLGWALRAIAALYDETRDPSLLDPCEKIVQRFQQWQEEFGAWLSFFTLHSQIRIPFMQSVGIRGLVFFEQIKPDERIRKMVVHEVDDILANCMSYSGRFFYKELPHLQRDSISGHWFECVVAAYRYTGDKTYLIRAKQMFDDFMNEDILSIQDAKGFACDYPGIAAFAKILNELK